MRILLHACCGPCLLEPYDALLADGHEVDVAYANPNIHPLGEYVRRRDTLLDYASLRGIDVTEVPYDPATWIIALDGETRMGDRCRACFRLRLRLAADIAAERGYDAFATTLTVSPYQDAGAIRAAGEAAAAEFGVRYLDADFRERYPVAVRRSRELGMYRQPYCGCVISEVEASEARDRRRARKAAEQAARGAQTC